MICIYQWKNEPPDGCQTHIHTYARQDKLDFLIVISCIHNLHVGGWSLFTIHKHISQLLHGSVQCRIDKIYGTTKIPSTTTEDLSEMYNLN